MLSYWSLIKNQYFPRVLLFHKIYCLKILPGGGSHWSSSSSRPPWQRPAAWPWFARLARSWRVRRQVSAERTDAPDACQGRRRPSCLGSPPRASTRSWRRKWWFEALIRLNEQFIFPQQSLWHGYICSMLLRYVAAHFISVIEIEATWLGPYPQKPWMFHDIRFNCRQYLA